jgi:hypothetical protein
VRQKWQVLGTKGVSVPDVSTLLEGGQCKRGRHGLNRKASNR